MKPPSRSIVYAYEYNPLFDPVWNEHEQPHVIGRAPFGRITIANLTQGLGPALILRSTRHTARSMK
jgi:hypothetical protein